MKILIAKASGFCMGVRRAVEMAFDSANELGGPIRTYGPLIHNPHVLRILEEKGISIIQTIPEHGSGNVLIRAHGVPPVVKEDLARAGFNILDATCPRVIKVQTIIKSNAQKGYTSIIIGDKDHPEVVGLLGYAGDHGYVVDSIEELSALPAFDKAIIVAQTTQNTLFFNAVTRWVKERFPHYKIFNTICDSTERRQNEVERLVQAVDALIVVGGHTSGNTKRLAEIARQYGKPAYHVESESELDAAALAAVRKIGITAGASTPNWIIKRVYRALEILDSNKEQGWRSAIFQVQRSLVLTNIFVSLGAAGLCYACIRLQGLQFHLPSMLIAFFYVQSMHIFNHFTGKKSDHYNDPDRESFYIQHKVMLTTFAVIAGAAGLVTAYTLGFLSFFLLSAMILLGLSYNLKILPEALPGFKYRRIRDIPGSKTVLIAVAWGVVTAILPPLAGTGSFAFSTLLVFIWSTGMVFVRTAFFDVLDMQGDRIVGKETIAILLGEKRSLHLLKVVLAGLWVLLIVAAAGHLVTSLGFALGICIVFMLMTLAAHERGILLGGIKLEFMVETHFILNGLIALAWSLLTTTT